MSEANLLTEWAKLLMRSFADAGITDVVLSPGSRSTPYLIAALREPRLRCYDAIDERGAAFLALGQARWTSRPSLLLCTSGTAAAHYYPAVVEASLARVPLLVVTADRPFELQECAAPQTIDQVKMYGSYARLFLETGMPDAAPTALEALRRMAAQAAFAARWPDPGPVHVNVRARKPLEPRSAQSEREHELARFVRNMRPAPRVSVPRVRAEPSAIADAVQACREARAGLIVCGPLPIQNGHVNRSGVLDLASATRFPLLAEVTSQLRLMKTGEGSGPVFCDAFDRVLASKSFREQHAPDLILQIGGTPTSGAWERYASLHRSTPRIVLAEHGWPDASNAASTMIVGDIAETATAIADGLRTSPRAVTETWVRDFVEANREARSALDAETSGDSRPLTEGRAVRALLARLPSGSALMLGNSLPIRHVESLARTGFVDVLVACQRGANGIDGLVAGTIGTALASSRPTTLLVGDVAFLHDLNSLMLARHVATPVVVVVLNNQGGRIFERLPLATESKATGVTAQELSHVTTPHTLEFGPAVRMFGIAYRCVDSMRELDDALATAYATSVCTVIECRTPPREDAP
ncbi:2-succinyl-5-enolpyruvyl-6-hydroxy-3-cyclohexene-1-carboxylic-acid synthase [Pendulispora brunnea]|uniref:2-succinyl-5-enolpyruvyl-6-hydroxy-3-cyclohexene-1-carboxylate synthase n=1 Tax=Pendulispora brunnea TaxID=2905690 RepID=A0ABZ2JWW5_9BACT